MARSLHPLGMFAQRALILACLGLLAGCDSVDMLNPFGKADVEPKVDGTRMAVLSASQSLESDASLKDAPVSLPSPTAFSAWAQEGGSAQHEGGVVALPSGLKVASSGTIGDGNTWEGNLIAAPVASTTTVYALDAKGIVSAHPINALGTTLWKQPTAKQSESSLFGGGLALDDATLYVTVADGGVTALEAATGKVLWQQTMDAPIRSAPTLASSSLLVMTAGSQLYALDARSGKVLWRHSGIQESASLLGTVAPAEKDGTVIAVYPSGEVYALNLLDGKVVWSDSLLLPQRTSALGTFSGVGGMPVITQDKSISISSNGLMVANQLSTGLRLWERPLSSASTPWVAGDYVFVITTDGNIICLLQADGRIVWLTPMPELEKKLAKGTHIKGAYVLGENVVVIASDGDWYRFNPQNGALLGKESMPSTVFSSPAFVENRLLIAGGNATLYGVQ